jgi:hypothetical protein
MLETKVITEVLIKQGEVASLTFTSNENEYVATITPQKITLSQNGHRRETRVAEYNRETKNSQWYLSHCCGAQGFGLDIDDKCHACVTPGSKLEATPENIGVVMTYGRYTPELSEVLSSGIIEYCQKLETQIRGV